MLLRRLFLVALLSVAAVMTAMAYSESTLTNEASAAVVQTKSALLAVSCNEEAADEVQLCADDDGFLTLDLQQLGSQAGIAANQKYYFDEVIDITNNSHETVAVGVEIDGDLAGSSHLEVTISSEPEGQGTVFYPSAGNAEDATVTLEPGEYVQASFMFSLPDDWTEAVPLSGTVTVTAESVAEDDS